MDNDRSDAVLPLTTAAAVVVAFVFSLHWKDPCDRVKWSENSAAAVDDDIAVLLDNADGCCCCCC